MIVGVFYFQFCILSLEIIRLSREEITYINRHEKEIQCLLTKVCGVFYKLIDFGGKKMEPIDKVELFF